MIAASAHNATREKFWGKKAARTCKHIPYRLITGTQTDYNQCSVGNGSCFYRTRSAVGVSEDSLTSGLAIAELALIAVAVGVSEDTLAIALAIASGAKGLPLTMPMAVAGPISSGSSDVAGS
jgi:hypothetical protein